MKLKIYYGALFAAAVLLVSGRTDRLVLEKAADFEAGKFQTAALSSKGKILSGKSVEEFKVDAASVWSMLELKPGQLLLGTGNQARLYQFENGKLEKIFEDQTKGRLAIPVIAKSSTAEIFFAVIPKAAIYRLKGQSAEKIAEPGVDYLWTLCPIGGGNFLAGGGPKAKIFLVKPDGKFSQLAEFKAEQVMDIIDAGDGEYLAGTSKPAMLIRFKLDGSYRVLSTFSQEELRAVRKLSDQSLLLALNQGPMPGGMPVMEQEGPPQGMDPEEMSEGDDPGEEAPPPPQIQPRMPGGKGAVYRYYPDRGMKQLLALKQATILSLSGDEQNGFFLGTDDQGKVYQIWPTRDEFLLGYSLAPGKVVSFAGGKSGLAWIGTAQPARLFKVKEASGTASYQSKILDSQFPSHWGRVEWRGQGKVKFQTRSGNTPIEDQSWSNWEEVEGPDLKIKSPAGRYIQFRAEWPGNEQMELSRVEISFLNFNQAQSVTDLKVDLPNNSGDSRRPMPEGDGGPPQKPSASVMNQCQISWRVDNPDQDPLFLALAYQQDGDSLWTKIADGDEIKGSRFQWNAGSLPDAWYRIKLTASDSPDNPAPESFQAEQVSGRFLIDSTKPEVNFAIAENGTVNGEATDSTSAISDIEFAVDDEDFRPASALDQVLDQKSEKFEFKLKKLSKGTHRITVQACDQADNCRMRAQEFNVK